VCFEKKTHHFVHVFEKCGNLCYITNNVISVFQYANKLWSVHDKFMTLLLKISHKVFGTRWRLSIIPFGPRLRKIVRPSSRGNGTYVDCLLRIQLK
jgi:hypothetical protein